MIRAASALLLLASCGRRDPAPATASAPATAPATATAAATSTALPGPDTPLGLSYRLDTHALHADHAIAAVTPGGVTVYLVAVALSCKTLGDATAAGTLRATGIAARVPVGPARDYYVRAPIAVPVHELAEDLDLPAAFVTLAIDRLDPAAHRVTGALRFDGRAGAHQLAGAARFDADLCDPDDLLAHAPPAPALHRDAPFSGRVSGRAFHPAHAFAITCGAPGARYIAQLQLVADPDARCGTPPEGDHVDLDQLGGALESAPVLHAAQPAGSILCSDLDADAHPGTASVTWDHLDLAPRATVTGFAAVDSSDARGSDGSDALATDASGSFSATVCAGDTFYCHD